MEEFIEVPLRIDADSELDVKLRSFQRRANDIVKYVASRKWGEHHISVNRSNQNRPTIAGTLPDELVLEGLYRRFRFFILNKEKSNYLRLLRLLSSASTSEVLHGFCRIERKDFFQEDALQFAFITADTNYRPEDVIDFWFNAYYFHDDDSDRLKLQSFENIISPNGARVVLWQTVWNGVRKVRNLNWLLRDTSVQSQKMYVPACCKI